MTENYMDYIDLMLNKSKYYSIETVEATLINYVCDEFKRPFSYKDELSIYKDKVNKELLEYFKDLSIPLNIELFIEFFESLLDKDNIAQNGIIFTPLYIANYISSNVMSNITNIYNIPKVIDPGCGCGIFLISAAENIHSKLGLPYAEIFNTCIYGIELDPDNVRRCKILLNIYTIMQGESNEYLNLNIICADSLKTNWLELFDVKMFDYVIGNPPYVNTHDMSKETATFLKKTFFTTKSGVYNIFYAFVEHAMNFLSPYGKLSYIVPNNFLTIKSAENLRKFITNYHYLERIIDFADNMIFKPVRTYNCIIQLSKSGDYKFEYSVLEKTDDIQQKLQNMTFEYMDIDELDVKGWKLVDKVTRSNISKIEGQFCSIRDFVRTGIATLRDNVYIVDYNGNEYYKIVDGIKYIIEPTLVKRLYKIPDLKNCNDIKNVCKYIIFPYTKGENGFKIIKEENMLKTAPMTYQYLLSRKNELDKRDKGKPNSVAWYAYGRTQGLNKYGNKLLFPTFASHPQFTATYDEYALFCNGYAVFENDYIELSLLVRILNSSIMQYYVTNTSYAIEGGYYCYQKKYIEKFSIPFFTETEKAKMRAMNSEQLDAFLMRKYGLIA